MSKMILIDEATVKLALEALEGFQDDNISASESFEQCNAAITALREALAEQPAQQEPVGCIPSHWVDKAKQIADGPIAYPNAERAQQAIALIKILLKSTPPAQRKPLTDEEIEFIRVDQEFTEWAISEAAFRYAARAIEAAHGIKEKT